jgi:hypothetical protein
LDRSEQNAGALLRFTGTDRDKQIPHDRSPARTLGPRFKPGNPGKRSKSVAQSTVTIHEYHKVNHSMALDKVKNVAPMRTTMACKISGGIAPLILNLDIRYRCVVSLTPRRLYPRTHWIEGWVGPRDSLYILEKITTPYFCRDFNPRSFSTQPRPYADYAMYRIWLFFSIYISIYLLLLISYLCTCKITTATGWQPNCSLLLLLLLLLMYIVYTHIYYTYVYRICIYREFPTYVTVPYPKILRNPKFTEVGT